jgi:hypothetical protein
VPALQRGAVVTRTYTHNDVTQAAEDAIDLFIEFRDVHGYSEEDAKTHALAEVWEGTSPATYAELEELREWQRAGGPGETR